MSISQEEEIFAAIWLNWLLCLPCLMKMESNRRQGKEDVVLLVHRSCEMFVSRSTFEELLKSKEVFYYPSRYSYLLVICRHFKMCNRDLRKLCVKDAHLLHSLWLEVARKMRKKKLRWRVVWMKNKQRNVAACCITSHSTSLVSDWSPVYVAHPLAHLDERIDRLID